MRNKSIERLDELDTKVKLNIYYIILGFHKESRKGVSHFVSYLRILGFSVELPKT